jgi:hypothetical protein
MLVLYAQQKMTQQMQKKAHTMSQGQLKFKMKEKHLKFITDQTKAFGNKSNPGTFSSISVKVIKSINKNEKPD